MLNSLASVSVENESKARKAVVAISIALILVSNLELTSDRLKVVGLEIIISQDKLIAVLKLALIVATSAFVLAILETVPKKIARIKRYFDARWWEPIQSDIDSFHRQMDPNYDYDFAREPEWDEEAYIEKVNRQKKRLKIAMLTRPIVVFTRSVANYLWPLSLLIVALFHPDLIFVLHSEE